MKLNLSGRLALIPAAVMGMAASAHAVLPTAVTTGIADQQADGLTLVGLLAAAGAAIYLVSKLLKKFGIFF